MSELTFEELNAHITTHFQNQTYADGLALADRHADRFPEFTAQLNYFRICLAARLEDTPRALKIFDETLDAGIWFSEALLRESPSLAPLQGEAGFEELIARSLDVQAEDPAFQHSILALRPEGQCGIEDDPCPLLLSLHSNGEFIEDNLTGWKSAALHGWLLAVPRSSNVMWAGGAPFWTQHEPAAEEVEAHFDNLCERYAVDTGRVVLGGFSMGAEVALWMALNSILPVRGFILLGPGGPFFDDPSQWSPLIQDAVESGLRGYVIFSEDDNTIPHDGIRETVEMLNEGGIPTQLEVRTSLGHEYPTDIDEVLQSALAFIMEGK